MNHQHQRKAILTVLSIFLLTAIAGDLYVASARRHRIRFHPALFEPVAATPSSQSLVGTATSLDSTLGESMASLDSEMTFEHVDMITRLAIERAGGLGDIIKPNDWVVIKPNIVTFYGQPGNDGYRKGQDTDLRVVKSLIEQLIEEGDAAHITVAEGGVWRRTEDPLCTEVTDGWKVHWPEFGNLSYEDMIAELQSHHEDIVIDVVDLNYDSYASDVPVPGGGFARDSYAIPRTILDCDKLISVAAMKTHSRVGVTLTHKNYVGIAPASVYGCGGWSKWCLPHDIIERTVCDLFSYHPADLGIIEGFWGTEGYGPQWGNPIARNIVLASTDPVAADVAGAYIMGFNSWDISHLHWSHNKGYGNNELGSIDINGPGLGQIRCDFAKAKHDNTRSNFSLDFYYGRGNRTWLINGTYTGTDMDLDYLNGQEASISPSRGDVTSGKMWNALTDIDDYIDLRRYWNNSASNCISYVFTRIISDSAGTAYLRFGSDDGLKIWFNGDVVYSNSQTGGFRLVENANPSAGNYGTQVSFRKGENRLLVKCKNTYGDYGFALCVSEADGDTPLWIRYSIEPPSQSGTKGDVNADQTIDVLDALTIVNMILGLITPTQEQFWTADCNGSPGNCDGDGQINVLDAMKIINVILQLDACP